MDTHLLVSCTCIYPTFWASGIPDLGSFVHELFIPQTGYHLWFVLMVFQFYILFPLFLTGAHAVRKRLEHLKRFTPKQVTLTVTLVAALLYLWLMKWSYYDMGSWTQWWPDPGQLPGIPFIFLGYVLVLLFTGCSMCMDNRKLEKLDGEGATLHDCGLCCDVYLDGLRCTARIG